MRSPFWIAYLLSVLFVLCLIAGLFGPIVSSERQNSADIKEVLKFLQIKE